MATLITKNSSTTTSVPIPSQLVQGELAVNVTDKRLFTEDSGGSVVEVGTNPSSLTLSSGTANGVTYLNGSKVLTSGTALVFDGTNLGVGTTSPATKLDIQGSVPFARVKESSTGYLGFRAENNSGNFYFGVDSSTGGFYGSAYARVLYSDGAYPMVFYTNATERMRLDSSGNLGIGTTSPSAKLTVNDSNGIPVRIGDISAAPVSQTAVYIGSSTSGLPSAGNGDLVLIPRSSDARSILFYSGNGTSAERMRLDSEGNLGLGVTPSAWFSSYKALQISSNGSLTTNTDFFALSNNAYVNTSGNDIYLTTGYAQKYRTVASNGQHQWYNAPSGTAGAAITFTQAMTLNASGNLGVGTTSPNKDGGNAQALTINSSNGARLELATGDAREAQFFASNLIAVLTSYNNKPLAFEVNGAEAMRLDSAGNLLVGTTSVVDAGKVSVIFDPASQNGISIKLSSATYNNNLMSFRNSSNTQVGYIYTAGTGTTYSTSSDYRLKENIVPMLGALSTVSQLKPCTYTWKADGSVGQGFIAHELQAVVPDCVTGEKDAVDEEGNPKYQGIDTSFLVATLTAAIQEQQAIITALTARITALEAK